MNSGLGLLVLLLIAAAGVVIVSLWARGGGRAAERGTGTGLLRLVSGVAVLVVVVAGASALIGAAAMLAGAVTTVEVPLAGRPPSVPAGVEFGGGPTAEIVGSGAGTLTLELTGLTLGTRVLLAVAALAGGAVVVVLALVMRRLARALLDGEAFPRSAARATTAAAAVVALGGTAASVTAQLGEWRAGQEALYVWGWSAPTSAGDSLAEMGWPDPASFALTLEFGPLLIALGLAGLAAVFRAGERLRAESAALRLRAEHAERDAEGLV